MVLEVVNREHASGLLDEERVLIHSVRLLLVALSDLQDVLESVQRDLDDLVVGALQQVAERLDTPLADEVANLTRLLQSSRGRVRHGPAGLLLRLEIGVLEDVDEGRDDVGVDDGLDLLRGSGGNVGDGPAGFLADTFFRGGEEGEEGGKGAGCEHDLRLQVVSSDDVTDGSEGRGLDGGGVVPARTLVSSEESRDSVRDSHEEVHETADDT